MAHISDIFLEQSIQDGRAQFVACHNESYIEPGKFDVVRYIKRGGTFFLNTKIASLPPDRRVKALEAKISPKILRTLAIRKIKFYIMDASKLATKYGLKGKINMICMSAFFRLAGVLPIEEALSLLKDTITRKYSYKGEDVVRKNHELLDGKSEVYPVKVSGLDISRAGIRPSQHAPIPSSSLRSIFQAGGREPLSRKKSEPTPSAMSP